MIEKALSCLNKLKDADAHATYIVENGDRKVFKELKINLTCENEFLSDIEIWFWAFSNIAKASFVERNFSISESL